MTHFEYWRARRTAPHHFPVDESLWQRSMTEDVDSDGRKLFDSLTLSVRPEGMIQYGMTAFGVVEKCGFTNEGITRSYYTK